MSCAFLPYTFSPISDSAQSSYGASNLQTFISNHAAIIMLVPGTFIANHILQKMGLKTGFIVGLSILLLGSFTRIYGYKSYNFILIG